jgi:nickel-dependent lactate racemase
MRVDLPYGDGSVSVDIPDGVRVEVVRPPSVDRIADERGVVEAALDRPVGAAPLSERARGCRRVVIVVPDGSRPARTTLVVPVVLGRLAAAGVPDAAISIVVGGGIHTPPAEAERAALVGADVARRLAVVAPSADDAEQYAALPAAAALPRARVHRSLVESDLVVLTGAVAPHYLAGFSGGAKGLVPGCADRDTVLAAHRLTLDATVAPDGSVRPLLGRPEGNPFAAALLRVARTLPSLYLVNVGLADGRVVHAAAGEVGAAHEAAWREHRARLASPRPEPADLVVAGLGAPRDRDLLQSHKALVVAAEAAKPGAPIVWLAHARDGAGHAQFLPWFEAGKPPRHLAALRRDFHPYGLTAYALRWKAARHPVHVVSTMPADALRPLGLLPFETAEAAVAHALARHRVERCVVLPRAGETFFDTDR